MLPQDVKMVVSNRDLQRYKPNSPIKELLPGTISIANSITSASNSNASNLPASTVDENESVPSASSFVALSRSDEKANLRNQGENVAELREIRVRLTKDTWVPHVHSSTSVAKVSPDQGLTCG